jgi:glycerophosphoryl diester phosphodiesterase
MTHFEIVAHRGVTDQAPENTIAAFQRAVELGADAIELDVRLTADKIPVVYHYYYLDENTSASGPIFTWTLEQLRNVSVYNKEDRTIAGPISTLAEVLESFAGKIGLEIEIKGPELEAPEIIGNLLNDYKSAWKTMEITSFEPVMLLTVQRTCPGIPADFLYPRSEEWMKLDVVPYEAVHYSRLAKARAVHLHPTQLTESVVQTIRNYGVEIHAWDVNDIQSLELITKLNIARMCTDNCQLALNYRNSLS